MTKRPESIAILGIEFQIQYTDDLPEGHYGLCEGWDRVIKIDKKLKGADLELTLMHEIFHAILHVSGWSEKLGSKTEEGIVRALEHGLSPLFTFRKNR